MSDIELVVKIPEELFSEIDDENYQSTISWYDTTLYCAIKNGVRLPKGHGDLIDRDELELDTDWDDYYDGYLEEVTAYEDAVCYVTSCDAEALDMAIQALEQQSSEDCISRESAIDIIYDYEYKKDMRKALEYLPSVTPKSKIGRWLDVETLDSALWHACSECGETEFYTTNYYPNCGAKMEVEE